MGVHKAMVLIGNAGQATSEGKSGPVKTGLTGPAATALDSGICRINRPWTGLQPVDCHMPTPHRLLSYPLPQDQAW